MSPSGNSEWDDLGRISSNWYFISMSLKKVMRPSLDMPFPMWYLIAEWHLVSVPPPFPISVNVVLNSELFDILGNVSWWRGYWCGRRSQGNLTPTLSQSFMDTSVCCYLFQVVFLGEEAIDDGGVRKVGSLWLFVNCMLCCFDSSRFLFCWKTCLYKYHFGRDRGFFPVFRS